MRTNSFACASVFNSSTRYDHQTTAYKAQFSAGAAGVGHITVAPFFSPDHSADSTVKYIDSAVSTIEIATPGFESWSKCDQSPYCDPSDMRAEAFPIFGALLNALHRGVAVRIVTNNYNNPAQPSGTVSLLDFLALNGANISFYTSTTFMHAKYMAIDGKVVSISSVNYSETSFMDNREAGLYITGTSIVKFCAKVFDYDFAAATPLIPASYTQSEMKIITDPTQIKVRVTLVTISQLTLQPQCTQNTRLPHSNVYPSQVFVPPSPVIHGAYVTDYPAPISISSHWTVYASPDGANSFLMTALKSATKSLHVYTYQITDDASVSGTECGELIALYKAGLDVVLLVSNQIYDQYDSKEAAKCYAQLVSAGVNVTKAPSYYSYSHNKYAIIDGTSVLLSTGNWSPSDFPATASECVAPLAFAAPFMCRSVYVQRNRTVGTLPPAMPAGRL